MTSCICKISHQLTVGSSDFRLTRHFQCPKRYLKLTKNVLSQIQAKKKT